MAAIWTLCWNENSGYCALYRFLAVAIGLINKAYVYKNDEMNVKELVMLIIPSLVGVTGYGILQYYLNIYEKDTGKSLTDTYGFYGALSFVHYFISIIAILVMTTMFQNWKVAQEEQTGQELVLNQVSDMKKHIGEVEKLYQDIRSLRHDMGIIYRCWNILWQRIIWMMQQNIWSI